MLSRNELKDLADLQALLNGGADLEQALADAAKKDAGADPANLAWILGQITIGPNALLPGSVDPGDLVAFRDALVPKLRALAFARTQKP